MKDKILNWFANGKVGISSKTMACAAAGIEFDSNFPLYTPSDPDDFNRCLLLLEQVPEIRDNFDKIAAISEGWKRLIARWNEVEDLFLAEAGLDWCNNHTARKTYRLMKSIGC